uniref:Uncharacterized protein n=1 Tax=Eutreptiella gymnastica TaxID=73025 RepID=A0A7S1IWD4_9EUGL
MEEGTKSWKSLLALIFLVLFGAPSGVAAVLLLQDWVDPPLRLVAPSDRRTIESIFAGGRPWLVSCVTQKSATAPPPKVLVQVAERLRPDGVRVARVHCWEPLSGEGAPTTLAVKYGLRSRPPVVMVTAGHGPPRLLAASNLKAKALAKKVLAALAKLQVTAPEASLGGSNKIGSIKRKSEIPSPQPPASSEGQSSDGLPASPEEQRSDEEQEPDRDEL